MEEHMRVIRSCEYVIQRGGATRQTYRWLRDIREGAKPAPEAYLRELRSRIPGFWGEARALEGQKTLSPTEHMQVIRSCGYVLTRGGSTQQTYAWFHNVRSGVTAARREYVEELAAHSDDFGKRARVLEEQRILSAEEHMKVIRSRGYVLSRGGTTQQTYKWYQNVKRGSTAIAWVYLREIEIGTGERLLHAKVIEEKTELNQADHMKVLRSRNFRLSPQGFSQRTFEWHAEVLAGNVKNIRAAYRAEINAHGSAGREV
ncbi:hypothetical protein [Streptomyces sp. NPDC090080]|uniref:hypothetical protein n=1 Tax=Streptomyces sp. NPDC090080 TaxID=3365939 RepID=UPI0037FF3DB4